MVVRPFDARTRLWSDETGLTGIELVVSLVVFGLVTSGIVGVLWSVRASVERFDREHVTSEAVGAVRAVDRGIRSGTALYPPSDDGMSLVVAVGDGTGLVLCVQWRVVGVALEQRNWRSDWRTSGDPGTWRVVADNVVNRAPPGSMAVPAFAFDTATPSATDVDVSILVNHGVDASRTITASRRVEASSVASRGRCSTSPPD
jgi:type II secretory pathway pseudopilin PulG